MAHGKVIAARFGLSSCPATIVAVALVFRPSLVVVAWSALLAVGVAWFALEAWIGATRAFRNEIPSARWVAVSRGLWLVGPWLCGLDRELGLTIVHLPEVALYLAGALFLGAAVLRYRTVLQLGQLFTYDITATERHELHTRGVYRFIRHPAYLGLIALCIVPGVLFESLFGTAFLALTSIPQTLHRIAHEELALRSHFGERYDEYRRRTGMLMPRWRGA